MSDKKISNEDVTSRHKSKKRKRKQKDMISENDLRKKLKKNENNGDDKENINLRKKDKKNKKKKDKHKKNRKREIKEKNRRNRKRRKRRKRIEEKRSNKLQRTKIKVIKEIIQLRKKISKKREKCLKTDEALPKKTLLCFICKKEHSAKNCPHLKISKIDKVEVKDEPSSQSEQVRSPQQEPQAQLDKPLSDSEAKTPDYTKETLPKETTLCCMCKKEHLTKNCPYLKIYPSDTVEVEGRISPQSEQVITIVQINHVSEEPKVQLDKPLSASDSKDKTPDNTKEAVPKETKLCSICKKEHSTKNCPHLQICQSDTVDGNGGISTKSENVISTNQEPQAQLDKPISASYFKIPSHYTKKSKSKFSCYNCGENHFIKDCPNLVCFKCGGNNHFARNCPNIICFKCRGNHVAKNCPLKINKSNRKHFQGGDKKENLKQDGSVPISDDDNMVPTRMEEPQHSEVNNSDLENNEMVASSSCKDPKDLEAFQKRLDIFLETMAKAFVHPPWESSCNIENKSDTEQSNEDEEKNSNQKQSN